MNIDKMSSTLNNGMATIFTPIVQSKMVAIFLQIKTGSIFEGKYIGTGISHLLEHSLFLGSKSFPEKDLFSEEVEKMGGIDLNAYTSYDHTSYFFSVFSENLEKALLSLKDFIFFALLDEKEINNEMGTILSEMDMIEDKPNHCFYEFVIKNYYKTLPYAYPIIGYRDAFQKLDIETLGKYYKSTYHAENIILSLAGNLEKNNAQNLVKKIFQDIKSPWNSTEETNYLFKQKKELWQEKSSKKIIHAETWHPKTLFSKLTLVYPTTDFDNEEHIALDILPFFLTTDKSSILYKLLKEEMELVKNINSHPFSPKAYASFFNCKKEKGYFSFSFDLPKKITKLEDFRERIAKIMQYKKETLLKIIDISLEEKLREKMENLLEGAKNNLLKDFFEEKESPMDVASTMAMSMHYRNDLLIEDFYLKKVKSFKVEDIQKIIKKYFCQQPPHKFLLLNKELYSQGKIWENSIRDEKASWIKEDQKKN